METLSARERLRADADLAGSRKWHRIQPQANPAPPPPKGPQAPRPPAHTPPPPERPLPPPSPPSRPSLSPLYKALCFVVGFVVAIALLIDIAPKPLHQPVNPAVLKPYGITGNPCGTFGSVKAAVLVDNVAGDVATRTYRITCSDGVVTLYTAP